MAERRERDSPTVTRRKFLAGLSSMLCRFFVSTHALRAAKHSLQRRCAKGMVALLGFAMSGLAASSAHALSINSVTLTNLSDANYRYYGNACCGNPNGYQQFNTDIALTNSTTTSFSTQFTGGSYAEAQTQGWIGDVTLNNKMGFRVDVAVSANPSEVWDLTLDSERFGAVVLRWQGHNDSYIKIDDISVGTFGADQVFGTFTGAGTGGNWQPGATSLLLYDECSDASVCSQMILRGTGSRTVSFQTTWNVLLHSDGTPGVGDSAEVGYMFGQDNTLRGNCCYIAGDFAPGYTYNGVPWDSLQQNDQGHFVTGVLTLVPEPSTALLLGVGLLTIAARRRHATK